jgi:hypothetical protein
VTASKRTFTFEEARRALPLVRARTEKALQALAEVETGGDEAGDEEGEKARERLERAAAEILEAWARDVTSLGIEVKGPWLVDFDSGAGYYCWKWPEESLEFFHGYDEGFAGRIRIQ